jgi:hypothetical protein
MNHVGVETLTTGRVVPSGSYSPPNHVSDEALNSGRMIPPGTNIPPAYVLLIVRSNIMAYAWPV